MFREPSVVDKNDSFFKKQKNFVGNVTVLLNCHESGGDSYVSYVNSYNIIKCWR